jgi:hypothetical protein
MVGIDAVWINQCSSILPQVVINLLYITVYIITKSEQSNFSLTHGAQTNLRVYYMCSITVHIMRGGGGGGGGC